MTTPAYIPILGNPQSPIPQNREGVAVSTSAGPNLFREGLVLSDPTDPNGRAPVSSSVGLTVNVASSVALSVAATFGGALGVSSFTSAIGISSYAIPIGVSSFATPITISSVTTPLGISTLPASFPGLNISTFTAPIGVSSHPAFGVSSFTAGSLPGMNVSSFTAASLPALGVSSLPADNSVMQASTAGGISSLSIISAATTNSTVVKAGPGQVYGWSVANTSAAYSFLKIFNASSAVQISTAAHVLTKGIQPLTASDYQFNFGIPCSTGIYIALTGQISKADNTATAVSTNAITIYYK